mgnify:CR=1 FL=1
MKITLDISKLVEEGKLTREEADKLKAELEEAGATVEHVLVFFFYDIYPEARTILSDLGVTLHSLATWWDVLAVAKAGGNKGGEDCAR